MKGLILGIGNPILGDDAIGLVIAREVKRRLRGRKDLTVIESCCGGLDLLDYLDGYDCAWIIDAVNESIGEKGDLVHLGMDDFGRIEGTIPFSHTVNLRTAIAVGERFGYRIPRRIDIFGIVIQDGGSFREGLSPGLKKRVGALTEQIIHSVA